jgi:hypothetical protein
MAATFNWCESNGPLVSGHGTTRSGFGASTAYATDCNWKATDNCTANGGTPYTAAPIIAGQNSFEKFQYGKFTGTYTTISNGLFAHTSGSLGVGLSLKGTVTTSYTSPSQTANTALTTDMTTPVAISSGAAVLFGADPSTASSATLASGGGYSQYFVTQLQTENTAGPGDIPTCNLVFSYQEN